jgi:hypothetical protein
MNNSDQPPVMARDSGIAVLFMPIHDGGTFNLKLWFAAKTDLVIVQFANRNRHMRPSKAMIMD